MRTAFLYFAFFLLAGCGAEINYETHDFNFESVRKSACANNSECQKSLRALLQLNCNEHRYYFSPTLMSSVWETFFTQLNFTAMPVPYRQCAKVTDEQTPFTLRSVVMDTYFNNYCPHYPRSLYKDILETDLTSKSNRQGAFLLCMVAAGEIVQGHKQALWGVKERSQKGALLCPGLNDKYKNSNVIHKPKSHGASPTPTVPSAWDPSIQIPNPLYAGTHAQPDLSLAALRYTGCESDIFTAVASSYKDDLYRQANPPQGYGK